MFNGIYNQARIFSLFALASLAGCGAEHYIGTPYSGVKATPTPTASPKPTSLPRPFQWAPPLTTPYGYSYTPRYELPCGVYSAGSNVWNYQCENAWGGGLYMCRALNPHCVTFSGRRLTADQATGRRAWTRKCYDRFQIVMQQQDVADQMATAGNNSCPEYAEFGIPQPDGSFTYTEAPTSEAATCSSIPVTALPVMFCAK